MTGPSWADDVMWVYERLDEKVTAETAGYAPSRRTMHNWANDEDARGNSNRQLFLKDFVPKAEKMIQDSRKLDDEAVLVRERKSIAELKGLLKDALVGAQDGYDPDLEEALKR